MANRLSKESRERIMSGAKKSAEIQQQRKIQRVLDYYESPKKCVQCNGIILYEKRSNIFCGSSCAAKKNNLKVFRFCGQCQKTLDAGKGQKKYCSNICFQKFQWEQAKKHIESTGKADFSYHGFRAKRYLLETRGHKCEICNLSDWQGKSIPIVLDHINGNSDDWRIINLRLICPNCDAQTPTYKGKNIGNGRHIRRQRYADGKRY